MNPPTAARTAGLDALRGFACLAVFAVHSVQSRYAESGWIAMPVFFVLSGHLITCSLLAEQRLGSSSTTQLRRFFFKRALRILPALLIFMAVMVPITASFADGSDAGWGYALLFVHNFYVMSAAHQFTFYFNNFWSLSVEEQFYLCYPWIIVFAVQRRTAILTLALLLAPLSRLALSLLASQQPQWFTSMQGAATGATPRDVVVYVSSLSHLDAFSLGGLLALHGKRMLDWFARGWRVLLVTGVAIAIGALVTGTLDGALYRAFLGQAGSHQQIWGYTVLNLWACAVVSYFASMQRLRAGMRMFGSLGLVSYEFYMVHFPVIALFATYLTPNIGLLKIVWIALQFAASLLAATLLNRVARLVTLQIRTRLPQARPRALTLHR